MKFLVVLACLAVAANAADPTCAKDICVKNAGTCATKDTVENCKVGFTAKADKKSCVANAANCAVTNAADGKCTTCSAGFYAKVAGACTACTEATASTCDAKGATTGCKKGNTIKTGDATCKEKVAEDAAECKKVQDAKGNQAACEAVKTKTGAKAGACTYTAGAKSCTKDVVCAAKCNSCTKKGAGKCDACNNGYWIKTADDTCQKCTDANAATCGNDGKATLCKAGFNVKTADKTCEACAKDCKVCAVAGAGKCDTCNDGFWIKTADKSCQACTDANAKTCGADGKATACKSGYYVDATDKSCKACGKGATSCTKTTASTCDAKYFLQVDAKSCCALPAAPKSNAAAGSLSLAVALVAAAFAM